MKKKCRLLLLALAVLLLAGCQRGGKNSEIKTDGNRIFITKDQTVSSSLVYTSDVNDVEYDEEEMKAEVGQAVAGYNESKGAPREAQNTEGAELLPVSLASCTVNGTSGNLVFDYASGEHFVEFSQATDDDTHTITRLTVKSGADALADGSLTDVSFVKPDQSSVTQDEIAKQENLVAVILDGAATVQTEGQILYVSGELELIDGYTAKLSEGTHYIIFK